MTSEVVQTTPVNDPSAVLGDTVLDDTAPGMTVEAAADVSTTIGTPTTDDPGTTADGAQRGEDGIARLSRLRAVLPASIAGRTRHRVDPAPAEQHRAGPWVMPPGLSTFWRWALVVVLVVQIGVIATAGIFGAFKLAYFSPVDEGAHFAYIEQIAEHGSLPVLGKSKNPPQVVAVAHHVYPRTYPSSRVHGLSRLSYEAFQPPLYYLAAAPAFLLTSNYVDKVYAVRLFDVVLLLASVALAGRLARVVLRERWLIGWSMVLVFMALPGVVVRFVLISNLALAVPLAVLFATELWIGWTRHSGRRLAVAGLVLGLCVLTELELLLLIPVFALVVGAEAWRRRKTTTWRPLLVAVAVPVVVMAPWFAFNEANYHMFTAGPIAVAEQTPIINPNHLHYSLGALPNDTAALLLNPTLPDEWGGALGGQPALSYLDQLVAILLIPAALVLIVATGRRLWTIRGAILALPWALNMVEMWYIRYGQQWAVDVRYTYATVPILLILAADATDIIRSRFLPILVTVGATVVTLLVWGFFLLSYTGPYALT